MGGAAGGGSSCLLTLPCSPLLPAATIPLNGTSDSWYQEVKAVIQQQQARPIWTAEDQLNGSSEDLDLPGHGLAASSGDLSCDSRANSDYEDTDGEGTYTDREGEPQDFDEEAPPTALARSSEPVWVDDHQGLMGHGTIAAAEVQVGTWPCGMGGHNRTPETPHNPFHACQRGSQSFFSSLQADSHYTPDQRRQDSMR